MKELGLQLGAVKAFPVWPSDGWESTHPDKRVISICLQDYTDMLQFIEKGEYVQASVDAPSNFWKAVLNREQHIRKRMELFKDAAPDAEDFDPIAELFYKNEGSMSCDLGDNEWWESSSDYVPTILIPRPTQEELDYIAEINSNEKWVPPTGQECEATYGEKVEWQRFVLCDGFAFVLIGTDWLKATLDYFGDNIEYRPLKTATEKKRDKLVAKAYFNATGEKPTFDEMMDKDIYSVCEALVDAKWIPNGDSDEKS